MQFNNLKNNAVMYVIITLLIMLALIIDDTYIKAGMLAIVIIYIGYVVFKKRAAAKELYQDDPKNEEQPEVSAPSYTPNEGESFEIVSPNKKIEIITAEEYIPELQTISKTTVDHEELKVIFQKIANESYPAEFGTEDQFSYLLDKIMTIIKELYMAHSAIFFWYNKKKEKITLEKYVSSSRDITVRKFDVEDDILSQIVQNEEPKLLTDIPQSAEADNIRYYNSKQGIRSFVGVPVFYGTSIAGIIALDSKAGDAFGVETVYSLGRFVRIISVLLTIFDEKHKEMLAQKKLTALLGMLNTDSFFTSDTDFYSVIENSMKDLLHWDAFAFVLYDPAEGSFRTSTVKNNTTLKYIDSSHTIELQGTLVGKSITTGTPIKIDDTSVSSFTRYYKEEKHSFDGSFMAIPLVFENKNYGVLCFENLKKSAYTNADVRFMKKATKFLAFIMHSYSKQSVMRRYIALDIETHALNKETFVNRLKTEMSKLTQLNIPGAVALIYIDKFQDQESLFESNPFPKILHNVTHAITSEIGATNMFGRMNERTFAVFFFNVQQKDVFLWAEKMRVKIARTPVEIASKQTTFTISVGVAPLSKKTNAEEVLNDAELALHKALEKGGNSVKSV